MRWSATFTTVPSRNTIAEPAMVAPRISWCRRSTRGSVGGEDRASVGVDLPEAVRAVDRAVHPRLERDLCLVAALGAEDREVLAGRGGALVASRAAQLGGAVAAI